MRDFEQSNHESSAGNGQWSRVGRSGASATSKPIAGPPRCTNPAPADQGGGQRIVETHRNDASPDPIPAAETASPESKGVTQQEREPVQSVPDHHRNCDRFAHPLVAEIVETWRLRQDMVRAGQKLVLQAKAVCRRFCAGDKAEADRLYTAIEKGRDHPLAATCGLAILPYRLAGDPIAAQRDAYEKHLARLAKGLPVAHMVETVRGINHNSMAAIVGELGDLSAYEKGIAGIWKRAGLAVIDGERQRRVSGQAALLHGYSPSRRSVFWNIGTALIKAQGKDENAGPYRLIYDAAKEKHRPKVETDLHAHNRAMREMTKALLKDIWIEWRKVA